MKTKILAIAVFGLSVVACGKSDEGAGVKHTGKDSAGVQLTEVSEAPAATETSGAAVETVASSEAVSQDAGQADSAVDGEAVYKKACMSCHMTGAAGAPKVGDASAWKPRIDKGAPALLQSAITGVPGTAMMARGTCGACTDDDLKAAVDYMIAQSR